MKRVFVILAILVTAVFVMAGTIKNCEIQSLKDFTVDISSKEAMEVPISINTRFDDDSLLDWYILNQDSGSTYWSIFVAPTYAHSGSVFAACYYDTLFSSTLRNDDWLLTPRVLIEDNSYELRFWTRSIDVDGDFLDDYEVWVSPTGDTTIAGFTAIVDSVEDCPWTWGETVIDLSAYAGDTIRVAFRYVSQDDWMLMLDDVSILPTVGVEEGRYLVEDFALVGNRPNPFNAATTILANDERSGVIEIFGIDGKLVNEINMTGGRAIWDGSTSTGEIATCGIYFYRLAGTSKVFRAILLK